MQGVSATRSGGDGSYLRLLLTTLAQLESDAELREAYLQERAQAGISSRRFDLLVRSLQAVENEEAH